MFRFTIIKNNYKNTDDLAKTLKKVLLDNNNIFDEINPQYIFIIGGDGTFLKTVQQFQDKLSDIIFIPFKSGGSGYYTNKNEIKDISNILTQINNKSYNIISYELIEILNGKKTNFVCNEVKILDETKPTSIKIFINDEYLETFWGTGLVVSTSSGSTGYAKSINGAVILSKTNRLFQLQEIAPINTNKYRSLNSSIILSDEFSIKLEFKNSGKIMICDTKPYEILSNFLEIKSSSKKANVLVCKEQTLLSEIQILRDIFIKDKEIIE